ncbi:SUCO family protein [Megaselia abdita]
MFHELSLWNLRTLDKICRWIFMIVFSIEYLIRLPDIPSNPNIIIPQASPTPVDIREPSVEFIAPIGGSGDVIQNDTNNEFEAEATTSTTTEPELKLEDKKEERPPTTDLPHPPSSDIPLIPEVPTGDQNKGPIPSFSEWAQRQMEQIEAEKKEEVPSTQKKNITNSSKTLSNKVHAKNYASLECGAKIIASNSEAQHTGALLTSTKDEYMLSPCTNRIWFVVELCEAIQAEKIELANFELFSSSPKNFTVAVSNRFPTRDWSNVGRFIAEDQRNMQSFNLHPHLFGKFVRVDIHSHYNSEHFCPVSLFRVFGTSEFEAFETENRDPEDDGDDIDDEDADVAQEKESNILKSASNVVISIVKKAAEALVKTNTNKTEDKEQMKEENLLVCWTPSQSFQCAKCEGEFVKSVNYLLKSKYLELSRLLGIEVLRKDINSSNVCANYFDIDLEACGAQSNHSERETYLLKTVSKKHLAALCHLMANSLNGSLQSVDKKEDSTSNLTIGKEIHKDIFEFPEGGEKVLSPKLPEVTIEPSEPFIPEVVPSTKVEESSKEGNDVNIFNVNQDTKGVDKSSQDSTLVTGPVKSEVEEPTDSIQTETISKEPEETMETSTIAPSTEIPAIVITPTPTQTTQSVKTDDKAKEELVDAWESLDKFMSENQSQPTKNNFAGPQSESVFIRLSNRIKALERNMSLSGQYLEELSRRYKMQVEELQNSFVRTLQSMEEQSRREAERERYIIEENSRLKTELEGLTLRLNIWIILCMTVGVVGFLLTVFTIYCMRSLKRRHSRLELLYGDQVTAAPKPKLTGKRRLLRRKSIEGVLGKIAADNSPKIRRPSEEAMRVNGTYNELLIPEEDDIETLENESRDEFEIVSNRQRKKSICYTTDDMPSLVKKRFINRQDSAPGDYSKNSGRGGGPKIDLPNLELICDEDYENFLPGSDLAYNEFMPDGPSGQKKEKGRGTTGGKIRRLSSPAFLKSQLTKSFTRKSSPHESTGWEWYRGSSKKDRLCVEINGGGDGGGSSSEASMSIISNGKENNNSTSSNCSCSSEKGTTSKSKSSLKKMLKKVF